MLAKLAYLYYTIVSSSAKGRGQSLLAVNVRFKLIHIFLKFDNSVGGSHDYRRKSILRKEI